MSSTRKIWEEILTYRDAKVALGFIIFLVVIALSADFIAGDYPLIWKEKKGAITSPIIQNYIGKLKHGSSFYLNKEFKENDASYAVWPMIRYSQSKIDRQTGGLAPAFSDKHILGTDQIGRDVASGMIHGTRIALFVGILAVFFAAIFGIGIGMAPAYYGDDKLRVNGVACLGVFAISPFSIFYANALSLSLDFGIGIVRVIEFVLFVFIFSYLLFLFFKWFSRKLQANWNFSIPLDLILMRLIEVFRALPGLFIILSLLVLLGSGGVGVVIFIIALMYWTIFARYVRGEFLRIRDLNFVKVFLLEGKSDLTIMYRHMLPNAISPLLIVAAFATGSAIILESTLSFLGLGLSPDYVSWGSLMNQARSNFSAWWLAVFPGFAILCTVLAFNTLGRRANNVIGKNIDYTP